MEIYSIKGDEHFAQKLLLVDDEKVSSICSEVILKCPRIWSIQRTAARKHCRRLPCQPDLILLDITMPELDGLYSLRTPPYTHFLSDSFLTARDDTADKIRGFQAGADDYIVKPFDIDELGQRGRGTYSA